MNNVAAGINSFIGGGKDNHTGYGYATIGGGRYNSASSLAATVGGGEGNSASDWFGTVGGGGCNSSSSPYATVGGGNGNTASGNSATVGGGGSRRVGGTGAYSGGNTASGSLATVSGGVGNTASGDRATVSGGGAILTHDHFSFEVWAGGNVASGVAATVSGGASNTASGYASTVGGGGGSVALSQSAVSLGNIAAGVAATVPGGRLNTALGDYSFASGRRAKANHAGAFVWGDSQDSDKTSSAVDEFNVYASGGTRIFSDGSASAGVLLAPGGGSWSSVSDRASKENLAAVDTQDVLERVCALAITTWNYEAQDDSIRHMGPMAQDFHAAFGLGVSDKTIDTIDPDGVALAAIQGLNERVSTMLAAKDAEIAELHETNVELAARIQRLEARLAALAGPETNPRALAESR